jgi:hypothetical protein
VPERVEGDGGMWAGTAATHPHPHADAHAGADSLGGREGVPGSSTANTSRPAVLLAGSVGTGLPTPMPSPPLVLHISPRLPPPSPALSATSATSSKGRGGVPAIGAADPDAVGWRAGGGGCVSGLISMMDQDRQYAGAELARCPPRRLQLATGLATAVPPIMPSPAVGAAVYGTSAAVHEYLAMAREMGLR